MAAAEETRCAFLSIEGEVTQPMEGTAAEIAAAYDAPLAKVEQVCEWADEMGCDQGFATGAASSVVVEPV